ncbi:MAG: HD-GYP domain-containing protein, partial [Nitrospina sp.]|nr:HD-GYP domain-containing protein [Nitrospina sp.]MBT6856502.1 HD-GYP domain-containing protein [Nitrospina sp.]
VTELSEVRVGAATEENNYREINIEFLAKGGDEGFDIFYKTDDYGTTKFIKFASTERKHQEKIMRILEEGADQEYYIHEDDLFKYYKYATNSLKAVMANPNVPLQEKTEKIYEVSKGVMKEFFENNVSEKILESSEEVMEMMEDCMSSAEAGFHGIAAITSKDYYTYTHSVNVGLYCMTFGLKRGMTKNDTRQLALGGMLHDVGKSKIDHALINKNGKLTDEEFEQIKVHAAEGGKIISGMGCFAGNVVRMAAEHHEKFKGGGYPLGKIGDEIHLHARICKIMDVYDALTTRRSYKKALGAFDTLIIMKKQMAHDFDPDLMQDFIRLMGPDL